MNKIDKFNPSHKPELILTFNEDGTVEKETKNFKGKSCTRLTAFIDKVFGAAKDKKLKTEYFQEESGHSTQVSA